MSEALKLISIRISQDQKTFLNSILNSSEWIRDAIDRKRFDNTVIRVSDEEEAINRKLAIIKKIELEKSNLHTVEKDPYYVSQKRDLEKKLDKDSTYDMELRSDWLSADRKEEYKIEQASVKKEIEVIQKTVDVYESKIIQINTRIAELEKSLLE